MSCLGARHCPIVGVWIWTVQYILYEYLCLVLLLEGAKLSGERLTVIPAKLDLLSRYMNPINSKEIESRELSLAGVLNEGKIYQTRHSV
jgi:hypothetical protein